MNDVGGLKDNAGGARVGVGAERNVDLVGGREDRLPAFVEVLDFPPPLVANHFDIEGAFGESRVLDVGDGAGRDENENDRDENGENGPGELNLGAAVDLRRFLVRIVVGSAAEFANRVGEEAGDDDENACANEQDEEGNLVDQQGRSRLRVEHVGDRVKFWVFLGVGERRKKECREDKRPASERLV